MIDYCSLGVLFAMLWCDAEFQNLSALGKEIVVERFMKNLGARENLDLFQKDNFSYLWGLIGVAGIKGTSDVVRHKIWDALRQFGVVDAFDKGELADFNRRLAEQFPDGRLKAWKGLDNFQASVKFRKTVLDKLVKTDADLAQKVSPYCVDYKKMMEQLDETELSDKLKAYLERFRGMGAACGVTTDAVAAVYEKTDVLRKLCDVAAYTHRKLTEKEKDYLFRYFFDAVNDGFSPKSIGLDDAVLAKLMADEALDGLSELEAEPLLARNAEIEDFAAKFESQFGFYEETEAKFIKHEFGKIRSITERCLKRIQKDPEPKGVVFAMMLVELNQIKSAVQILLELAKKGRAIELIGFLHRLLPKVKGSEAFILDIICINLQNFHGEDVYFVEYAARRTLAAVRTFIEAGCSKQAAILLKYLVLGNWFLDKNELVKQFILLANTLMILDDNLTPEMSFLAEQLNLRVFETENGVIIGTDEDNPLAMSQQKIEQFVAGTSMLNWAKYASEDKKKLKSPVSEGIEGDTCDIDVGIIGPRKYNSFKHIGKTGIAPKPAVATMTVAEKNTLNEHKTLQQNIYKHDEDIVIPQKIQDKTPELTTHTLVNAKPVAKIPSSADILRSYSQKDNNDEIVSELPSSQLREKIKTEGLTDIDVGATFKSDNNLSATATDYIKQSESVIADDNLPTNAENSSDDSEILNATKPETTVPFSADLNPNADELTSHFVGKHEVNDKTSLSSNDSDVSIAMTDEKEQGADSFEQSVVQTKDGNNFVSEISVQDVVENYQNAPVTSDADVATDFDAPKNLQNHVEPETFSATSFNVPENDNNSHSNSDVPFSATQEVLQNSVELPKFEEWNTDDENEKDSTGLSKININSILNINSKEVDKHFEHIKQIATAAMKKAEEQAIAIKKKVEDTDLANSPSVSKIKAFAQKIKLFRKK